MRQTLHALRASIAHSRGWLSPAVLAAALLLGVPAGAAAQLTEAAHAPVVYSHHHLNVTSVDEHKKFWVNTLGGAIGTYGNGAEVITFPNVLIMLTRKAPAGGTKTSTIDHVAFQVRDLRGTVDKVRAAGYPIITREELPPASVSREKDGIAAFPEQPITMAFVMGPDQTKVELVENTRLATPIALHHVHFFTPDVKATQAWYDSVFGATPGVRGGYAEALLPGVRLTFSPSAGPVAPTPGRALDHIGFEIKDLEAFTKRLESMGIKLDRPFTYAESAKIHYAFITDPWGTFIELTEGFDQVK